MNFEDLIWLFTSNVASRGVVRLNIAEGALLYKYCKKNKIFSFNRQKSLRKGKKGHNFLKSQNPSDFILVLGLLEKSPTMNTPS